MQQHASLEDLFWSSIFVVNYSTQCNLC